MNTRYGWTFWQFAICFCTLVLLGSIAAWIWVATVYGVI